MLNINNITVQYGNNKPILENGELKRNDDGKQKQYDILKQ